MTATREPTSRSRTRTRVLWGLQILLGLFIISSALPKLFGQAEAVETFDNIGWGDWFRYFTGAVELAGGIGVLIPRLAGAAAAGLVGLMIGAVITELTALDRYGFAVVPAVLGVLFALIAWERREEIKSLVGADRR